MQSKDAAGPVGTGESESITWLTWLSISSLSSSISLLGGAATNESESLVSFVGGTGTGVGIDVPGAFLTFFVRPSQIDKKIRMKHSVFQVNICTFFLLISMSMKLKYMNEGLATI